MKSFEYTIKDKLGIHARPAGELVKLAKEFNSRMTIEKHEESTELSKLLMLMKLGVKCGETVLIKAEGEDEDKAIAAFETFFNENL